MHGTTVRNVEREMAMCTVVLVQLAWGIYIYYFFEEEETYTN
jgi:hypothetical protein